MTHLHVTFCDIERGDAGVGETAREDTTEHALRIVGGVVGDRAKVPAHRIVSHTAGAAKLLDHCSPGIPLSGRGEVGHY